MYNFFKKSIKVLIPKEFLFKNELFFRSFYGFFFRGKTYGCNICSKRLKTFLPLNNNDLLCPFCGSLSRHRRLLNLLKVNDAIQGRVLHFSPSRSLYRKLKRIENIIYYSSDFEGEFLADYNYNMTNIDQTENTFNTIICYHILEHITEDLKAIKELYRVLKPAGKLFIQTPFKKGKIYEDSKIILPKERELHFGQNDHVRIYSVEGLKNRLESVGFKVNIKTFKFHENDLYHGLLSPETVLIASK